jgi:integrase
MHNGVRSATLRNREGQAIRLLTDYIDHVAEKYSSRSVGAQRSAMNACVYALEWFATYLLEQKPPVPVTSVHDETLKGFREWAYSKVKGNPQSRGFRHQIQNSVNIKLTQVYDALAWLHSAKLLAIDAIGRFGCKVTSTAPDALVYNRDEDRRFKSKYPQCYKDAGESSSVRPGQHFATPAQLRRIDDYFWQTCNAETATRNCVMARILDFVGWRIDSANSLLTSQFDDAELARSADEPIEEALSQDQSLTARRDCFLVTPHKQKFGYARMFEVPWELAAAIRHFIDDADFGRRATLSRLDIDEATAKGRLFVSMRTGAPLSTATWSTIFGEAFKAVGAPKGAGAHAVRRGAGDRRANEVHAYLTEAKLPVTMETVSAEVAEFLGQTSLSSQQYYRRAIRRLRRNTVVDRLARENEQLQLAQDKMRAVIAMLVEKVRQQDEENAQLRALKRSRQAPAKAVA